MLRVLARFVRIISHDLESDTPESRAAALRRLHALERTLIDLDERERLAVEKDLALYGLDCYRDSDFKKPGPVARDPISEGWPLGTKPPKDIRAAHG